MQTRDGCRIAASSRCFLARVTRRSCCWATIFACCCFLISEVILIGSCILLWRDIQSTPRRHRRPPQHSCGETSLKVTLSLLSLPFIAGCLGTRLEPLLNATVGGGLVLRCVRMIGTCSIETSFGRISEFRGTHQNSIRSEEHTSEL